MDINSLIQIVTKDNYLTENDLCRLIKEIRAGKIDEDKFCKFLSVLHERNKKGLNVAEILAFTKALQLDASSLDNVLCTSGTGREKIKTINVSTPVAVIVATAGIKVLKHGFRGVTSNCGSRDIVSAWGINPFCSIESAIDCTKKLNIGYFDFFSLLPIEKRPAGGNPLCIIGPLSHPIKLEYKLLGCVEKDVYESYKQILTSGRFYKKYMITFGEFIDEISLFDKTLAYQNFNGKNEEVIIKPWEFCKYDNNYSYNSILKESCPEINAGNLLNILAGKEKSAKYFLIAINAGAALHLAGETGTLQDGYELAKHIIDSGKPLEKIKNWALFFNHGEKFNSLVEKYVK